MKNIVFISASPKINEQSSSREFLEMDGNRINADIFNKIFIDVRKSITQHKSTEDYETISQADAIIISFPLYVFSLPGILIRYLQDYYQYYKENGKTGKNAKVYAIVNCGFPEPEINQEAIRVINSFCHQVNAEFRSGIMIGGGPALLGAKNAPFMKKNLQKLNAAFSAIAEDIKFENSGKEMEDIYVGVNLPRRLYFFVGDRGWISAAKKNRLSKKDLYRKPYRSNA